jgi:purine-binding chemotaxis protein CheW
MKTIYKSKVKHIVNAYSLMPKGKLAKRILSERALRLAEHDEDKDKQTEESRYIRFCLGKEFYGIPYEAAKEIMHCVGLTKLPHAPRYIAGVVNRRGVLLTVVDLRIFLNINTVTSAINNKYIIVIAHEGMIVGILADNIEGNDAYIHSSLDDALPSESLIKSQYILGIHKGNTAITNIGVVLSDLCQQMREIHSV